MKSRKPEFTIRLIRRREGMVGYIYQRQLDTLGRFRLRRIGRLNPLALRAASSMLRHALPHSKQELKTGKHYPLSEVWGMRLGCYALITERLRSVERLGRAAWHMERADPIEAAYWLGRLQHAPNSRPLRALRILVEAVD